jgi:hypothetical protein
MERRFSERKREIEDDAHLDKTVLTGSVRRLQQFGQPFFKHFRRSETRQNAQFFLEGLLSDLPRKNVESIAYRNEQDRQALQRFVGQTDWDHTLLGVHQSSVANLGKIGRRHLENQRRYPLLRPPLQKDE